MTPQETTTIYRTLKTWQRARIISGVLAILAGIATIGTGVAALTNEHDTSSAMKLPVALALVCIVVFVHAQKRILSMSKPSNSPSQPSASGLSG